MNGIDLLKNRRSIRKYKDQKIPKELLKEIVDIAKYAPSWGNLQIARYTIIDNEEIIKQIANEGVLDFIYNKKTLENTKGIAVLTFVKGKSGKIKDIHYSNSWEIFDAGIACQTFCLSAFEKGIGTCIFGVFNDKLVRELAKIPEEETIGAIITYGFPDEVITSTKRKETAEILRFIE